MTEEELREAYPGAADLIVVNEFGCDGAPKENLDYMWEVARKTSKPPAEIVSILKQSAEWAVATTSIGPLTGKLHQFDHPDFLRYVSAKLGAMVLLFAALLTSGCSVTGKVYCEHKQGPDVAGASVEFNH